MVIEKSLRENFFPMRNALDRSYRDRLLIGSKVHVGACRQRGFPKTLRHVNFHLFVDCLFLAVIN